MNNSDTPDTLDKEATDRAKAIHRLTYGPHPKRLYDWEPFDDIRLTVVPRYKMSYHSGDEWRQGVNIQFYFKGQLVFQRPARDMQTAIMLLGYLWEDASCPIHEEVLKIEKSGLCFQPSCQERATVRYYIKREYGRQGEKLDPTACKATHYREFCEKHATRGDCGLEDADDNYTKEPPNPNPMKGKEVLKK